jgi:hypothetical protein
MNLWYEKTLDISTCIHSNSEIITMISTICPFVLLPTSNTSKTTIFIQQFDSIRFEPITLKIENFSSQNLGFADISAVWSFIFVL